ncbi:hypothetical protein DVS28_b0426 (plasmid) [Euzebya pacifica]|uniref:Uncharacterized protein n=2 Tax=Euzebya pacifica TaxID=1608957 RepID=A0A346Y6S3_9ACTN|nr:hypothetical protein DVS28_b0426 [Euzebya pacifica]
MRVVATAGALRDAAVRVPALVGQMLREEADWYDSLVGDPAEVARCGMTGWAHGTAPGIVGHTHPVAKAILLLDAGRGGNTPMVTDPVGTVRRWEVTGALLRFDPYIEGLHTHHPHPCRVAADRLAGALPELPDRLHGDAGPIIGELRNAAVTLRAVPQHAIQEAGMARTRSQRPAQPKASGPPEAPAGHPTSPRAGADAAVGVAADGCADRLVSRRAVRPLDSTFSALVDAPISLMPHDTAARIGRLVTALLQLR